MSTAPKINLGSKARDTITGQTVRSTSVLTSCNTQTPVTGGNRGLGFTLP